ncbi:hypothetical protein L7F22_047467 [Adiantum nelumboides]|nr:hypothetical protein [Adiantum nelumboides]
MDTNKEGDSQGSDKEESQKGAKAKGPFEHEKSDKEDTSTPLDKKSNKPRSEQQILLAEAQARVEERKKMLADARAAKVVAAQLPKPKTMEEARLARVEKAKALQEEKRRIEAKQKAQEVDLTSQSTQEPKAVLELQKGKPKKQHQEEDEERLENIQMDPTPPSPSSVPLVPHSSPKSPVPPNSPPAPSSPQQQAKSTEETSFQPPSQPQEAGETPAQGTIKEEVAQKQPTKLFLVGDTLQAPLLALEEPSVEEAYEAVKTFDYTKCCSPSAAVPGPGSYGLSSASDAANVASYIWDNYLGGSSASRPLGPAVLDGVDFDIEIGDGASYYGSLAQSLRQFSSQVVLGAAPQRPFPDAHLGPNLSGSALDSGLFNYVWVQFYNNPSCQYGSDASGLLAAWQQWTSALPTARVLLGLPASEAAAGSGFLPSATLLSDVLPQIRESSNYGGIMLYSYFYDETSGYGSAIKGSV